MKNNNTTIKKPIYGSSKYYNIDFEKTLKRILRAINNIGEEGLNAFEIIYINNFDIIDIIEALIDNKYMLSAKNKTLFNENLGFFYASNEKRKRLQPMREKFNKNEKDIIAYNTALRMFDKDKNAYNGSFKWFSK